MKTSNKSILEMIGEILREIGILLLVFGFLDRIINKQDLTARYVLGLSFLVSLSFCLGIASERLRKE